MSHSIIFVEPFVGVLARCDGSGKKQPRCNSEYHVDGGVGYFLVGKEAMLEIGFLLIVGLLL